MVTKEAQQRYKGIAAGTSSGLSMVGSLYILGRYWYARRVKTRVAVHHMDVTKELIHVLAWLDLVGAVGRCFGVLPTNTYDQDKGERVTSVCQLQAFVITFGDVSPIAWNFLMAYNLFRWVCLGEDQQMLQRRIKWYICGTLVFTLSIDTLALAFNAFGAAGQWCWVVFPGDRTKELYWKLITLYAWVLLGAVAMTGLLILVKLNVQKRLTGVDNDDARVAYHGVVQNLTIYIVSFIVCWCPAVLDRGYSAITGTDVFTLSMLHTSIVPLQGFVNAVIYGKFHVWVGRHLHAATRDTQSMDKSGKSSESLRSTEIQQSERRQFGTATIFVTSFDMNWTAFPANLHDWIPPRKDLYVFSLQHCVDVHSVEQAIRKHLLQINYPMGYRSITSLSGSIARGHGHDAILCQIVFVNNADIASGNFQFHTSDGRAWSQRKTFKGVVGMPMRYFEASLAFVSCNLSPTPLQTQAHARTEVPIATKHAATLGMVESFEMDADRASVDFPYLYHHTILSGNLNYSIDMPRSALTTAIDQAYKAESLKRATDAALDVKLRHFGQSVLDGKRSASTTNPSTPQSREPANSNVPVEWNLLYFKSRGSLGRASCSSNSSAGDDEEYEAVFTADHDGLPFTELRSPACLNGGTSFVPVSNSEESPIEDGSFRLAISDNERLPDQPPVNSSGPDAHHAWLTFLSNLFPNAATHQSGTDDGSAGKHRLDTLSLARGDSKKVSDWMTKSQLVLESCKRKWQDVLRHDELRVAIEAKEILCGFEEPPITFLPSCPRRLGVSASYSMLAQKSCKEVFADASEGSPAYKDRILLHSLPDTRQRIRNIGYWLCEDIVTSSHKPVCSEFELEIDRFFSYKNAEADVSDVKAGKLALKDKSHIQEYKIKLVNLDANIWTFAQRNSAPTSLWRSRGPATPDPNSSPEVSSVRSAPEEETSDHQSHPHELRSVGSFSNVLGKMKRKSMHRSAGPSTHSSSGSRGSMTRRGRLDSLSGDQFDLVPVDPTSIATIFPLPSEDVYALQRKVHEVAHSVQNGFQSSARDQEGEEASLAYTNFRSISWKEAHSRGVMHSAITKAVNGVIHVAIKIEGDGKAHGGQGILCIQERDLVQHAAPVINEAEPIPFDVPLTWGGKHVGYLHGDILSGL